LLSLNQHVLKVCF